jgi:hypothetical protein
MNPTVSEKERQVSYNHFAHSGVEGGKQLILSKEVRLAEKVHDG